MTTSFKRASPFMLGKLCDKIDLLSPMRVADMIGWIDGYVDFQGDPDDVIRAVLASENLWP